MDWMDEMRHDVEQRDAEQAAVYLATVHPAMGLVKFSRDQREATRRRRSARLVQEAEGMSETGEGAEQSRSGEGATAVGDAVVDNAGGGTSDVGDAVRSAATEEDNVTEEGVKDSEGSSEVCGHGATNSLTETDATNVDRVSDSDPTIQTIGPVDQLRKKRRQRRAKGRAQKRKRVLRAQAKSERTSSALNQAVDTARRVREAAEVLDGFRSARC
ncbi:hypothetical protein DVH05_027651 [Phytophthora capsici]|nr:hypothetical protein DVH05_027651 [Phytophthora capsici]